MSIKCCVGVSSFHHFEVCGCVIQFPTCTMFANVDQTIPKCMKTFLWFWSIGSGYDDVNGKNVQGVQPKQGVRKEMFQSSNMIKVTIKVKTMETIGGEHQPSDGRRNYNNDKWGFHWSRGDDHQPKWGHQKSVGTRLVEGGGGGGGGGWS